MPRSAGDSPFPSGKGAGGLGLLHRILYWTGGHPYLTQRLCQAVAQNATVTDPAGVDRLCQHLFLSPQAQERDDNLLFVRDRLLKSEPDRAGLLDLYAQIQSGRRVRLDDTNPLVSLLRLSGITRVAEGWLRVRNRIYAQVFDQAWVIAHMPDAELRRQRAAYRRGLLRATAVATSVVAVISVLALVALGQARRAAEGQRLLRRSLYASQISQAQQAWNVGDLERMRELLATAGADMKIKLWSAESGRKLAELKGHTAKVLCVTFSPDGRTLASGSGDWMAKLWDLSIRREIATLQGQTGPVWSVAFSPDGKRLATGGTNMVRLWDVATKRELKLLRGHGQMVNVVTFTPRGGLLASASEDGTVKLWDVSGKPDPELFTDQQLLPSPVFSQDGKTLAVRSGSWPGEARSGEVRLWDPVTGRERATLWIGAPGTEATSLSPDWRTLAVARESGLIQIWKLAPRRRVAEFRGATGNLTVALSPDSRLVAFGSDDHTVRLWDIAPRRQVAVLRGRDGYIRYLSFSPRASRFGRVRKLLAWSDFDPIIRLWDLSSRREIGRLTGHTAFVNNVAFSPDGETMASASSDHTVKLWDRHTRREIATLKGHLDRVVAVAFSPDGQELATGSFDLTVKLWNLAARLEVASFTGHRGTIFGIAFSPDGSLIASGGGEGAIRLSKAGPPAGRR